MYVGSSAIAAIAACSFGCAISIGLRMGNFACASRLGARPSRNRLCIRKAFIVVGALRLPRAPPTPSDTGRWSVKPRVTSWQVAQATVPSLDKRVSKYSFLPSATRSGFMGLSAGITTCRQMCRSTPGGGWVTSCAGSRLSTRTVCSLISRAPWGPRVPPGPSCHTASQAPNRGSTTVSITRAVGFPILRYCIADPPQAVEPHFG